MKGLKQRTINAGYLALVVMLVLMLQGCTTNPVTGRRGLNVVSTDQEMQLGLSSFDQLKKETPISRDPAANAMVRRVGEQIAKAAQRDMPNAQWEFVVFDSKEANAFCLPGGKVGVYTGILPIAKTDAGLATVLGHEVAHAVAHHGAQRMSEQLLLQGGEQLAGAALSATKYAQYQNAFSVAYGLTSKVGVELPFDRAQETDADRTGIIYMARAGYDPREAVEFWKRFAAYNNQSGGGAGMPAFLRTHPLDEARIKDLEQWLPRAEKEFQRSPLR